MEFSHLNIINLTLYKDSSMAYFNKEMQVPVYGWHLSMLWSSQNFVSDIFLAPSFEILVLNLLKPTWKIIFEIQKSLLFSDK